MKFLRVFFCGFSLIAALIALAQHLGFDLWGCASCSFVNETPMSFALAWGGPVVLTCLTYALHRNIKRSEIGLGAAAACSVVLVAWMILSNIICLVCIMVHIGVFGAALTLIPRPRLLAPLAFSLAIVFTATGGFDRFSVPQGTAVFRPRAGETIPDGKVFVLFTDPECGRCQLAESQIENLSVKPKLLYRWSLLPHTMYRSIRAAALVEMARIEDPDLSQSLRVALSKAPPPLTDSALLGIASKVGLGDKANAWLRSPSEAALSAITDDQSTTTELKLESLPALAELSAVDQYGQRTLRLVPLSKIGI
jgi:hypothetical protein